MLLTCPHCETIFRVDTTDIKTGGRKVRCSVCGHVWQAKRGGADVITEEADLLQQFRSWQGVVVAILLVIALTAFMTVNRNLISANLPQTKGIYTALGLTITPDPEKVEVGRLSATRKRDTIRVTGEVTNLSSWAVHSPPLMVTVSDSFGLVLAQKSLTLDLEIIPGGMSLSFSTQVLLDETLNDDVVTEIVVVPVVQSAL
ncbi:MAG: zinc-ribbon domain-containing protein [Alphaproteobacteria bacterium]|nr:zinc-ribbon domain-containing protein [Alphaproteobacteria bacterium]